MNSPHKPYRRGGNNVKPTDHNTKAPHTATGIFVAFRGLLDARGTGAPKTSPAGSRLCLSLLTALVGVLLASLLLASTALAAAPEAPSAVTVESITATTANLRGVLNPNAAGEAGTYEFLYRAPQP